MKQRLHLSRLGAYLCSSISLLFVLSVLFACPAHAQAPQSADEKLALLSQALQTDITDWRVRIGEVENGQDTKFDDSGWTKHTGPAFTWGQQPLAWLRTRVTIPADIAGVSTAGSKITFRCGVDDDGTIYVNGAKVTDFHWDQGRAVLTENAQPGQTFDIAIRNTNGPGDGRLLLANLEFSCVDSIRNAASAFVTDFNFSRQLLGSTTDANRTRLEPCLAKAMDRVDLDSLKAGKIDTFLLSLNSAAAELKPINDTAKGITINLCGHAHIDMNWLWLWPETLEVCRNTFNTMDKLMDEFPGFRFSQSQPAVYAAMKETAPEVFAKIKDRVKRGQWDTRTATSWVEGDLNMASGESIVRSILYGKRFMKKEFGVESDFCWEPDTFGHPVTVPQILAKSGIKYYYFMRCDIGKPLFWWQSPDGSRVLAYSYGVYNKDFGIDTGLEAARFARQTGIDDYMHVYGVGDHGGGPTRDMLTRVTDLSKRHDFPKLYYSTPSEYMEKALKQAEHPELVEGANPPKLPVHTSDLNYVFEGCYTSHADVKRWNRECENLLPAAEAFSVLAGTLGLPYPRADFEKSWRKTCFNQFHDIFDGTAIHGSYEYSGQLYNETVAQGKAALDKSLAALAGKIDTRGSGIPIVVYNPLAWARTDAVTISSASLIRPGPGPRVLKTESAAVADSTGKLYPAQLTGQVLSFTAANVPAMGYKVFWLRPTKAAPTTAIKSTGATIENQFFRITADPSTGVITSIVDKKTGRETLPSGAKSAVLQMRQQKDCNAWFAGNTVLEEDITGGVRPLESGPAKITHVVDGKWGNSWMVQELSIYDNVPRIDIHTTVDWQEVSGGGKLAPMLKQGFAVDFKDARAMAEVPFGCVERPMDGHEVPAQKWIDVSGPNGGLSILNDCKHGLDIKDGMIWQTLMSSPNHPDPRPDQGKREWTLSIYPHTGDWRSAGTPRRAYELNNPLIAIVGGGPSPSKVEGARGRSSAKSAQPVRPPLRRGLGGGLPCAKSFLSVSAPNIIVTALKKAEDDDSLILRFYETDGKPCRARMTTALPVHSFVECDLMERPIGKKQPITKGAFTVSVGKCEIKTYKLMR